MKVKLNNAQKIIVVLILTFILLCEIWAIGVRYTYRLEYKAYHNVNKAYSIYQKEGIDAFKKFIELKYGATRVEAFVQNLNRVGYDGRVGLFENLLQNYQEKVVAANNSIMMAQFIALGLLVIGIALFLIIGLLSKKNAP